MTLFAFHKQYLDTLHVQKKKEMNLRMHNYDFDMLRRSVHLSPKLHIPNIHKDIQKLGFRIFIFKLYLAQNLRLWLGTSHPIFLHLCKYTGLKCEKQYGQLKVCLCIEKKSITNNFINFHTYLFWILLWNNAEIFYKYIYEGCPENTRTQ